MIFEEAHLKFINGHLSSRPDGERRARLERGLRHAEILFLNKVWWPLRGHFEGLHPEYEVMDWRGRSYYADFVWLPGYVKLLIEIKGYSSHVRDMDRQKYCNELNRETFLYAMGYHVISFAYDDVEQRPELCMTLLRMVLGRYQPADAPVSRVQLMEQEVLRLPFNSPGPSVLRMLSSISPSITELRSVLYTIWLTKAGSFPSPPAIRNGPQGMS
ncbi:endonuclease domain-containing protein [Paenibacillus borealis]|uniref:endonuclease domain-containing protein n=1 Tax=Paenibacillus borealis TaxID=160799 RepID=UPI000ACD842A|nr:endonuclease domain-containing protein [Paenibacillus borealis]